MTNPSVSGVSPWFISLTLNANEMRNALQAFGASDSTGALVAETGVMPGLNAGVVAVVSGTALSVQPFQAVVRHPTGTMYVVTVASAITDLTTTTNATSTRYDRIVVEVLDSDLGTGDGAKVGQVRRIAGTAGSGEPTLPVGCVELARVAVSSSGQVVLDRRQFTRARGAPRLVTDATVDARPGAYPGDLRAFPTGRLDAWTGSAWVTTSAPAAWTQVNVNFTYAGAGALPTGNVTPGTGGASSVRYKRVGNDLKVHYQLTCGTGSGGGAGQITTVLPAGMTAGPRGAWLPCHLFTPASSFYGSPGVDVSGMTIFYPNTNQVIPFFPIGVVASSGVDLREAPLANSDSTLLANHGVPLIPNGFPLLEGSVLTIGPGELEVAP